MNNEEHLADNIARMGSALGTHMHRLEAEFFHNICNWREYRSIYGTDENRIALINEAAPSFFYRVKEMMRQSVLLGIARLIDPRKDAVSLKRLPRLLEKERGRLTKSSGLDPIIWALDQKCKFATEWRNRHIAHRSEALVIHKTVLLPSTSRKDVDDAHAAIGAVLNEVQLSFGGVYTLWDDVLERGNAEVLLHLLSDGIRGREQRCGRFSNGAYTQEDISERSGLWLPLTRKQSLRRKS